MIASKSKAETLLGKRLTGLGNGRRSFYVLSEDGTKNLGGPYTKSEASNRLRQVEYFKRNPSATKTMLTAIAMSPVDEIAATALLGNPSLFIHPNEKSRKIARKALDRRRPLPKSKRGGLDPLEAHEEGIGSGVLRARDIAAGKRIDAYRVKSFFDRHRNNYLKARAEGKRWEDSKALQAWYLWGGEPLRKQVEKAVSKNKIAKNPKSKMTLNYAKRLIRDVSKKGYRAPFLGGLADGKLVRNFDVDSLARGLLVEFEHSTDPMIAMRIAMDHLTEDPEYYQKLRAIEDGHGPYELIKAKKNPTKSFEHRPHNWDEILIDRDRQFTRNDILEYYKKNKKKIWPYLKDQFVMVILATGKNNFVRKRHGPDRRFIKMTKLEGLNDPRSFEYWIHRRAVEFHPTLMSKKTPMLWLDLDMHSTKSLGSRKDLLLKMKNAIPVLRKVFREMGVKKTHEYWSGTDGGIHMEGDLDAPKDVDALRRKFKKRLSEVFCEDPTFTTGIANPWQIRLDTTTLHKLGSLRAPYSMTVSGGMKLPIKG